MRLMTTIHDLMARSPVLLPVVQRDGGFEGFAFDGPIVANPTPVPWPAYDWYGTPYDWPSTVYHGAPWSRSSTFS